jgi:hypothetical protein
VLEILHHWLHYLSHYSFRAGRLNIVVGEGEKRANEAKAARMAVGMGWLDPKNVTNEAKAARMAVGLGKFRLET